MGILSRTEKQTAAGTGKAIKGDYWLPFPNFILRSDDNPETVQLYTELSTRLAEIHRQTAKKQEQRATIAEKGLSGKVLTKPTWEGPFGHPLNSKRISTEAEDERRLKRYETATEKYNKELAAAQKQDAGLF